MKLRSKLRMLGVVLAISVGPAAFADQLNLKLANVVSNKTADIPTYSISFKNGAVVLGIVGDFWTNSRLGSSWKATGPSASELALAKVALNLLLRPLNLAKFSTLLQKPLIARALSQRGWKVYKLDEPPLVVKVPEAPAFALLGLNMAALLGLAVIFRRRIVQLN